jgi:membrane protein implicated in regulation of membrane protease activity
MGIVSRMTGLGWSVVAISASAVAVAALIVVARAVGRRRRGPAATRAHSLGERRIEVVAIHDGRSTAKEDPHA